MKIPVTFKFPDAVYCALLDAGMKPHSIEWEDAYEAIGKFVRGGEYVTIVVDTDTGTAEVKTA